MSANSHATAEGFEVSDEPSVLATGWVDSKGQPTQGPSSANCPMFLRYVLDVNPMYCRLIAARQPRRREGWQT